MKLTSLFKKENKKMVLVFGLAVFFVVLDRFFKNLAMSSFSLKPIILTNFLKLDYFKNENLAFSLPICPCLINLLIVNVIVILFIYFFYLIDKEKKIEAAILVPIIFGAISNLFDRFKYGFVIDYIDLSYFTVFNFADAMIVCGVIILGIYSYKTGKKIKSSSSN